MHGWTFMRGSWSWLHQEGPNIWSDWGRHSSVDKITIQISAFVLCPLRTEIFLWCSFFCPLNSTFSIQCAKKIQIHICASLRQIFFKVEYFFSQHTVCPIYDVHGKSLLVQCSNFILYMLQIRVFCNLKIFLEAVHTIKIITFY